MQMVILPMVTAEIISLFIDSNSFSVRLSKKRYYATGYVATMVFAFFVSSLYKGQGHYAMALLPPREVMENIFIIVPAAILEGFGIAGNVRIGSFASLMQMMIWAFLALVAYGLIYIFSEKNKARKELKDIITILAASVGITTFVVSFTTAEASHNYFLFSWFISIVVIGTLVDCMREKESWFADIILFAVCVFAVMNIKYTYIEAVTTTDNLKEYEEVADFLIDEGISQGYAEFWDAARISLVRNGAVTMGSFYTAEKLETYWWLTSTKWYPPNLPKKMKTAYVIKKGEKDVFMKQFSSEDKMELYYENNLFSVYISDTNYLNAW